MIVTVLQLIHFHDLLLYLVCQKKNLFLTKILTQTSDSNALSLFLVTNFRQTFIDSQALGMTFPTSINQYMFSLVATTTPTENQNPQSGSATLDLVLGSKGSDVVRLQEYLINKNVGPQAHSLSLAGATGNFGPLTESALIEYQVSVGVSLANGYYGSTTRAFVNTSPVTASAIVPVTSPVVVPKIVTLSRNLYKGITGEDVRTLQKFLNTHGYVIASTGAGSSGNESTYFGQATLSAVIRFQKDHNITPALGYVGPLTRASLVL